MMLQKKSNPWMRTKALYIIPVAVIALSAFATPELNNRIDAIAEQAMPSVIADKGTTNSSTLQENTQENIAALVEQDDIKEENDSVVLYIVGGKVVSRAECLSVSPNDIKAMTIVKDQDEIKKYTDNKRVTQAIIVELKSKDDDTDNAYGKVERVPQFPGGMEAMMKYVADNIKYPESAKKQGLGGRVIVEFYVEKDGSISEVKTKSFKSNSYNDGNNYKDEVKEKAAKAERKVAEAKEKAARAERKVAEAKEKTARAKESIDEIKVVAYNVSASVAEYSEAYQSVNLLTDEAERVVRSMPKWEPGIVNGTPARVHFFIPISFNID